MRVHPITGRVAHGIAGDGVYVDGVEVAKGGGLNGMPDWWGDRLLWPSKEHGCVVAQVPGTADAPVRVTDTANLVRAGAEHWAAWSPDRGVWTSWGLVLPMAVLLDMAWDDTLFVGDYYHAEAGIGASAYRPGALTVQDRHWHEPGAQPANFYPYPQASIISADVAIWTEPQGRYGRVLRAHGLPPIDLPWSVLHSTACLVSGETWVTYLRPDDTVVSHPWAFDGRGLLAAGTGFGPLGTSRPGAVDLRWSRSAAEVPGDIVWDPRAPSTIDVLPPVKGAETPVTPAPAPPETPPPAQSELAVTVIDYTREVTTPGTVSLEYQIEGAAGHEVRVDLLAGDDVQRIAESWAEHGRLEARISWAAGEYALVVRATSADGREARTGARRVVRLVDPEQPPAPPTPPVVDEDPRDAIARRAFTDGVRQLYSDVLGREADPSGLAHYVGELMAGRLTLDGLRDELIRNKAMGAK